MNHNKYEQLEKKFIRAEKELDEVQTKMYRLPYRELKEPYQSGWDLIVTLREDVARSSAGPVIQTLIDRFARNSVIRNPKYISHIRKKRTVSAVNGLLTSRFHWHAILGIRDISKKEYESLNERQRKYFEFVNPMFRPHWMRGIECYQCMLPEHYLTVRITKRMVTHVQDIDPILLKRKAELRAFLRPYYRRFWGRRYAYDDHINNRKNRRRSRVETHLMKLDN